MLTYVVSYACTAVYQFALDVVQRQALRCLSLSLSMGTIGRVGAHAV